MQTQQFLEAFVPKLRKTFGERLWFAGLQGSRSRGEERPDSDIDLVVILDRIELEDVETYRALLDSVADSELACGFFAGRAELEAWSPPDLLGLVADTTPIVGTLDSIAELVDGEAVRTAIQEGVCSLYHACVHNMLYDHDEQMLIAQYKAATFLLRALVLFRDGQFPRTLAELRTHLLPEEQAIAGRYTEFRQHALPDLQTDSAGIFKLAKRIFRELEKDHEKNA